MFFLVPYNPRKLPMLVPSREPPGGSVMLLVAVVVSPHWKYFDSGPLFYATGASLWLFKAMKSSTSS